MHYFSTVTEMKRSKFERRERAQETCKRAKCETILGRSKKAR